MTFSTFGRAGLFTCFFHHSVTTTTALVRRIFEIQLFAFFLVRMTGITALGRPFTLPGMVTF